MHIRNLSIALVMVLLALFTALNWQAFNAKTTLSLGVGEVQAPLGLLMLGVTGFVSALFLVYIVIQQAQLLVATRRMAKEIKSQRALADEAEASRFVELRSLVQDEARRLEARIAEVGHQVGDRAERLARQLPTQSDGVVRALSAHLGEIEDKLDRALSPAQPSCAR